jgi:xanthine dehydrogenase FAD-binding subunit
MDLPVRTVLRPATLSEALLWLRDFPASLPMAGGTDLVVQLRDGRKRAETLLDLSPLALDGLVENADSITIGACTSMAAIARHPAVQARFPALAAAAGQVGAWPIQCRATLGGNLANASPAADTAPPLIVAGAVVELAAADGRRELAVEALFVGPGRSALRPGELIVALRVPNPVCGAGERVVERFTKVGPRQEQVISIVSLAARAVVTASGVVTSVRLGLGSVAPTPVRALRAESVIAGERVGDACRRRACVALQADISPIDDVRAPASYRRMAAAVLLDRFLAEVGDD